MKIVFATNNKHKLEEIRQLLKNKHEIISLSDIGCHDDIPEDYDTLQDNALQKARYIKEHFGYDCFADDTGLEIEALNHRPGVYSARYAGPEKDPRKNMEKVLTEMQGITKRDACFRTVIALILNGEEHLFEGRAEGEILTERHGNAGFGYDPIFRPEGHSESFAEMSAEEKNKISHRGKATQKLIQFLKTTTLPHNNEAIQ